MCVLHICTGTIHTCKTGYRADLLIGVQNHGSQQGAKTQAASGKKKYKHSRASAHDSALAAGAEDHGVAAVPKRHKVNACKAHASNCVCACKVSASSPKKLM